MSRHREQDSRYGIQAAASRRAGSSSKRHERAGSSSTPAFGRPPAAARGVTLVEMLVAMAITLVMMAAVVTLFANISDGVRNRRATVELGGQLRHVRNVLQGDLANATCVGLTWRRPESNEGYIEIIEGQYSDGNPSPMIRDSDGDGVFDTTDLDVTVSFLPRNNPVDLNGDGEIDDEELRLHYANPRSLAPGGLGDYDDILMLTARNENDPFVGRVPQWNTAAGWNPPNNTGWGSQTISSPLAEVIWFAVENPSQAENDVTGRFFGEPGMRTIYRRALLIAPWLDPYAATSVGSKPGVVRDYPDLPEGISVQQAIAELIAFQDQYDLSVRIERYPAANGRIRTRFVANTLGDLTKRENRYEHYFYNSNLADRQFPYAVVSAGSYSGSPSVEFVPAIYGGFGVPGTAATASANLDANGAIVSFTVAAPGMGYQSRPFVYLAGAAGSVVATARAMLNDEGQVVRVVRGLVPLWGARRGEDVMVTDALAFDLRVYDPGAPLYQEATTGTIVQPGDPGWKAGYEADVPNIDANLGDVTSFVGQGAYVDLGYGFDRLIPRKFVAPGSSLITPWFFASPIEIQATQARYMASGTSQYASNPGVLTDVFENWLAPGYAVYDTWSFHYENNGLDEDHDSVVDTNGDSLPDMWVGDLSGVPQVDEGTNGLDDPSGYDDTGSGTYESDVRLGVDDVGERETAPPYDRPLRGVQVTLRAYERDSRQIRQATVRQQLMPE
jgi:prepilin-type N-terminal cleavage/methylation domain-containing protein